MKTSDLERELGLSKHTIRYYEKEGFIDFSITSNNNISFNRNT